MSTESRAINKQVRGIFSAPGDPVFFSNNFEGGRLNSLEKLNDTLYRVLISPENTPINGSPWYAFKVWSAEKKHVTIRLEYSGNARHRYPPKLSKDGRSWEPVNTAITGSGRPEFGLRIGPDTTWIAAQELYTTSHAREWVKEIVRKTGGKTEIIGKSTEGRPLTVVKIGNVDSKQRIIVYGRQHPPEVTGQLAMNLFVEAITDGSALSKKFLGQFLVYVIPIVNPDGVDGGFWRHGAGGVDLNRDWAVFNQPEPAAIRDFLKKEIAQTGNKLLFGIDFHSTHEDIYYTVDPKLEGLIPGLVSQWLAETQVRIPGYVPNVKPLYTEGGTFTAFSYLFKEYGTESLVYEIGDQTPRDFIRKKGKVSADILMELLLTKNIKK